MNRAVLLVSACAVMVGISYGMHSPIVPVFSRDELAADYSQVGLIGMVNYLPYMFAPLFVGLMLDRINKSYILAAGIVLNTFAIFMLSTAQSVPEVMLFRTLAGVAHALFWPSAEVLISTNSNAETRIKGIATFTAAWVLGFMVGPLIGKLVLDAFDYRMLFQFSAIAVAAGLVPALLLRRHGLPVQQPETKLQPGSLLQVAREMSSYPTLTTVLLYYAVTFGVVLAIYPAYMREASLSNQDIEILFFVFGLARFATLYFVQKISRFATLALALAVASTAAGMLISFTSTSFLSFAIALAMIGLATSIFYPVTFNLVTRNTPPGKVGQKLGVYETLFGVGWTAGPIAVGLSSDAFGSSVPYLALFLIGSALSGTIALFRRK
ncbi:MAG TPA: MFS transporter [Nitrososphaera sp.]|jgi:DHA1 family multidrug resistance protein-like MFS transporter/DHA1 family quinolone resistance protein-like MFS transporter